ncbi:hypothetical protein [Lacinutrix chionoecetis]
MFEYPNVTTAEDEYDELTQDEHYISRVRSRDFNIYVHNTLKRIGFDKNLILAGLTAEQLSFLDFLDDYNIIVIDTYDDAEVLLEPLIADKEPLIISEEDLCESLPYALNKNLVLKVGKSASQEWSIEVAGKGLVVIENDGKSSSIIGINYAASIESPIEIIEPTTLGKYEIKSLISGWKEGNHNAYNDLSASIYPRIEHIHFADREFVTFFSNGSPYSLILENIVPISHVHLSYRPGFFVFNNIHFNSYFEPFSSIVFSPLEFEDEETDYVIRTLESNAIYVKSLIGKEATVYNIDNYVKEFPFSLIHFCSHGGEVEGSRITEEFTDSLGNPHIVTYDEIVSIAPSKYDKLIPVLVKRIWRELNGFKWKSKELKAQNIPSATYAEIASFVGTSENIDRSTRVVVPDSSHIKCNHFIYQAMFRHLAAGHSPFVFNNTCSSWSDIADSFLGVGAKGYLGTLWDVNNDVAKNTAEMFYSGIFKNTFLNSFYESLEASKGTDDENIYIFWGLHFSSMAKGRSLAISRRIVLYHLQRSLRTWKAKLEKTTNAQRKEDIKRFIEWNARCQVENFKPEVLNTILKHRLRR